MQPSFKRHVLSFAAICAAVLLRIALDGILGDTLPFVTMFGAVAAAVWLSGYRSGVAVALLGYLACAYFFISPRGEFRFDNLEHAGGLVAYLFTSALIIALGESMRRAQARASAEREVMRVTLRSIGDAVITTDVDGRVTYQNSVAESLTGFTHAEAFGQPLDRVFRIVNEETRAPVENPAHAALREGRIVGLANHTLLIDKNGREIPIDDSAAPIRDEHGRVSGCVLIFRDVSAQRSVERERANQLITASRLATIVESSDDAIVAKSLDGTIQSWNAGAERVFGYGPEEAVGRHISLIIPPDRLAEEDRIIADLRAGRRIEHYETERLRRDGQRIAVSLTISPIKDAHGNVVGASKIARDITSRKQAEAERQKFVTLIENSTDFIGMSDVNGMPFFVNRAGLEKVGLASLEEAKRVTVWDFFFPEDQPRIRDELFPAVLRDGHGEIEIRFRHFKTGQAVWMAYKVLALTDDAGKPVAFATVSQDVTERRRLTDELRKLASDLTQADRRKNEFVATLAHELRNPLAPLQSMLEVLERPGVDAQTLERARGTIDRQVKQLVRLVDDLLDLNRVTHNRLELRPTEVELSRIIDDALEAGKPLVDASRHELHVSLPAEPIYLRADSARLSQVFGNLINNSCKYTPRGGSIWVTAERHGTEVSVSVKDTGIGIPLDQREAIFEMFTQLDQSSVRSQGGLGIGLTLVRQLVLMHDGAVEVRSAGAGRGSEFVVRLPILEGTPRSVEREPRVTTRAPKLNRILVVDDNRDAAEALAMVLELSGNETHLAHDGAEALEAAKQRRPDAVLLDIGLPTMSGLEVCRRIRSEPWGRDMVLIALTGWSQDEDRRHSKEAGFDGHLVKPVHDTELQELLRTIAMERAGLERDAAARQGS
jgi:PAS domain S-box-containing protein